MTDEVTEILRSKGWSVSNQVPFIDPEENKHRMLDIFASKAIMTSGRKMATLDLIVECKKSVKPWVFHISKFLEPLTEKLSLLRSFGTNVVGPSDKELTNLASRYIENQLRKPRYENIAYITCEPFRKENQPSRILEASMQVSKAILYHQPRIQEMVEKANKFASILITLRPVVIFDGHIYVYEHDALNRVPEVLYRFRYMERSFLIEIVTKDFFREYLDMIDEDIKDFSRTNTS